MVATLLTTSSNRWDVYESEFKVSINEGAKDKNTFDPNDYPLN